MQKHPFIPGLATALCAYQENGEVCVGRSHDPLHVKSSASTFTAPQLASLRRIILAVIDDGCLCDGVKHPWELDGDPSESEFETEQRIRFTDEVQRRLVAGAKGE